jgi:chaperone required for assembly of F1-ATPase
MKRFYKEVSHAPTAQGWEIRLDNRPVRTPARHPLVVPTVPLAEAIAVEWRNQGDKIKPESMPLTRLANSAIDGVIPQSATVVADVAAYANSDLLCYWADSPRELMERQARSWLPLLDWAAARYNARLEPTTGIVHKSQSAEAVAALQAAVAALEPFPLAALHLLTTTLGSVVLALAVYDRHLDAETAFELSEMDERYQRELWGEDQEAMARRQRLRADVMTSARFLALLQEDEVL